MTTTEKKAYYAILDAYPMTTSDRVAETVGAVIGCWIRSDLAPSAETAVAYAKARLADEWVVATCANVELVAPSTYAKSRADGRALFRQCLVDGFVAHIHSCPRETIDIGEIDGEVHQAILQPVTLARMIWDRGCSTLVSVGDLQWANGVTPGGAEFVPLWIGPLPPKGWLEYWPDHEAQGVNPRELFETILPDISGADNWLAVGIRETTVTMVHPICLADALKAESHTFGTYQPVPDPA